MHEQLIDKAWRSYFAKVGRGAFTSDVMDHETAFKEAVKAVTKDVDSPRDVGGLDNRKKAEDIVGSHIKNEGWIECRPELIAKIERALDEVTSRSLQSAPVIWEGELWIGFDDLGWARLSGNKNLDKALQGLSVVRAVITDPSLPRPSLQSAWIPVEQSLPEIGVLVLICGDEDVDSDVVSGGPQ